MSKSNKEKERLAKIRAFKNGEINFDISMLKLKLNFYLSEFEGSKNVYEIRNRKKIKNIPLSVKNYFSTFLGELIEEELKGIEIFEFELKFYIIKEKTNLIIYNDDDVSEAFFEVKIFINLYYKQHQLCSITLPSNIHASIPIFSEKFNEIEFLSNFDAYNLYKKHELNFNIPVVGFKNITNNKKQFNAPHINKIPSIFKNFKFHNHLNNYMNFLNKNINVFKVNYFGVVYDLKNHKYHTAFAKNDTSFYFSNGPLNICNNNMDVIKLLKNINLIQFNIDDLTENEIIEMYELLNY